MDRGCGGVERPVRFAALTLFSLPNGYLMALNGLNPLRLWRKSGKPANPLVANSGNLLSVFSSIVVATK